MLALCLYALLAFTLEAIVPLSADTRTILDLGDTGVCLLFFLDFLISFARAEKKLRYLFTWGLIDLASSIPSVDILRLGRAARILRIFRVLRGVRAMRILTGAILDRRANATFLAAALISLLLVLFSSAAILKFESVPASNIKTPSDAIWWSVVTITTVGYGDRYPVSDEGRVLAALLMTAGVGLFGTFSGFVASWFLAPATQQRESEIQALRKELAEIKELMREGRLQIR
ncbi:MAG: ion transporter [Acidobacteria bacterium]|nr:MAG: ion transporter [Acidobacteriota bacterium]